MSARSRVHLLCCTFFAVGLVVSTATRRDRPPPYDKTAAVREATLGKTKDEARAALGEPNHAFHPPHNETVKEVWQYNFRRGNPVFVHFDSDGRVIKVQ
jgi:hypothetical protein